LASLKNDPAAKPDVSEPLSCESPSGRTFQICLEGDRFFTVRKGNRGFDPPGAIFCGMGRSAGIMMLQPSFSLAQTQIVLACRAVV